MNSHDKGRPLPKFGEWDVNNPASADGFTVIFAKARNDKKNTGTVAGSSTPKQNGLPKQRNDAPPIPQQNEEIPPPQQKKWFCCF